MSKSITHLIIAHEMTVSEKNIPETLYWYLVLDNLKKPQALKKILQTDLIAQLMERESQGWLVLESQATRSRAIDLWDFIAKPMLCNTHLGHLPTFEEWQHVLRQWGIELEKKQLFQNSA